MSWEVTDYDLPYIVESAADAIEEHGWVQGRYGSEREGFCAAGAVRYVLGGPTLAVSAKDGTAATFRTIMVALVDHVYGAELGPHRSVAGWNDTRGRSKQEVLDGMRATAKELAK